MFTQKTVKFDLEKVGVIQTINLGAKYTGIIPINSGIKVECNTLETILTYDSINGSKFLSIVIVHQNSKNEYPGYSTLGWVFHSGKVFRVMAMLIG